MDNKIYHITRKQYTEIRNSFSSNSTFLAEIDGKDIKNLDDYLTAVWRVFRFPQTGYINYHAYLDWIRDLDWLGVDFYVFVILNADKLMEEAPKEKKIVLGSLENTVLPWWWEEIEHYQVGGKAKSFLAYLVD
jgi:hypothetical protein